MPDQIGYDDIAARLRERLPEFGDVVDEHLRLHDELLPHVLFGDLTRFVLRAREGGEHDVVRRALALLDEALRQGDHRTTNLVALSFVQNVGPWDPRQADFIEEWPEALRGEAQRQREWRPDRG